ncbi:hypothetical protein M404DRAFT_542130 [Pisolithus tinctorius Marx 270]|uniref:Uncharacterized protein n=1 Tax=Pisolithus tinctorius Marx 270 TaxID=870435 RepID=A0A0C3K5T2_PISTI|nr:hypothetical protein M404DRAFT_542130 [Pisolithus tinctorius Marx 270]
MLAFEAPDEESSASSGWENPSGFYPFPCIYFSHVLVDEVSIHMDKYLLMMDTPWLLRGQYPRASSRFMNNCTIRFRMYEYCVITYLG